MHKIHNVMFYVFYEYVQKNWRKKKFFFPETGEKNFFF